ncbi:uncharacterized protein LOC113505622 [Trichoplusia ni]|uniref:Uncharacterized protein LOC113505622 n=1 Tax=Trichoplusia ni TaxID=7111 RepID=A0A7E5WTR2_TRINI|nr:uncharacterized protein LOC113505622 [Trichoplusia ni]
MPQPNKRRLQEIDDTLDHLTETLKQLDEYSSKAEFECSLITAKLKREKLKAMAAAAQSQILLAQMDVLIAETDLYSDIQRLKKSKKTKLDERSKEKSTACRCKSAKSASKSVKKTHNTTKETDQDQKKGPVIDEDTASNDTVLVTPLNIGNTESVINTSESILSPLSGRSQDSRDVKTSTDIFNLADNEMIKQYDTLLSNSMYAEFNTPYSKNNSFTPDVKHNHKTSKRTRSSKRSKSKENEVENSIKNSLQKNIVSAVKGIVQHDDTAMTPVRHNMPSVLTQPKRPCVETPCMPQPSLYVRRPVFEVFHSK